MYSPAVGDWINISLVFVENLESSWHGGGSDPWHSCRLPCGVHSDSQTAEERAKEKETNITTHHP